ncbi:MAG TPA: DUF4124 domain-containing protein [Casimicrobiaceae bacterium]
MRHSSLDGPWLGTRWAPIFRGRFVALILGCAFSAAPATAAEIYKCVAKDGTALYQNFPCNIDSIGSEPTATKPNSLPDASAAKSNTPTKATSTAQSGGEPRIGMTTDEVKALLGEPEEMVEDEPAIGGRVSNWRYADGRTVQFDHRHRVLSVQR